MNSQLTPRELRRLTENLQILTRRMEIAKAKEKVRIAKAELAEVRRRHANSGRVVLEPAGRPSVSRKKIREAIRSLR